MQPPIVRSRTAFTLVELLVVISIISVLVSILLPALGQARKTAQQAVCLSNLRQIGIVSAIYASNHDGWLVLAKNNYFGLPGNATWVRVLKIQEGHGSLDNVEMYQCPSGAHQLRPAKPGNVDKTNYGYMQKFGWFHNNASTPRNAFEFARRLDACRSPSSTASVMDNDWVPHAPTWWDYRTSTAELLYADARHAERLNVLWLDGHADVREPESITNEEAVGVWR